MTIPRCCAFYEKNLPKLNKITKIDLKIFKFISYIMFFHQINTELSTNFISIVSCSI